uniref:Uncharacterized protein n=1 Tax=uncultured bacterium contig00052 TaxID=1181536 RepID=A0A806JYV9_9BACT|nr:hypothetical protein [uncultured bacterium contig00052]
MPVVVILYTAIFPLLRPRDVCAKRVRLGLRKAKRGESDNQAKAFNHHFII